MYHKTVLENGVRIITEGLDHLQSVSMGIWVDLGSRDEDRLENGISHFIEHMIFKGTQSRTGLQIAKELDAIGGLSNAFTGKENTCFHTKVLGKHFSLSADILSDIFLNSTFEPRDINLERQVILEEIRMMEDTPEDNIHTLFNRLFWIDHPIGMSIIGSNQTVSAIEKNTISKYIKKYYVPERILLVAAGNIEHEAMVSHFRPLFIQLDKAESTPKREAPRSNGGFSIYPKDLEQVHICLGGEAPSQRSEQRFACSVFNTILGGSMSSRLFQEIREKRGLAYNVYSFLSSYIDTGMLGVYVATDKSNTITVLETIQDEIQKIMDGELSESDLSAAKEHMIGGIYLASESADHRMMRLARNEFIFERFVGYDELVASLEKVTVDNVIEAAHNTFQNGKVSLIALGPLQEGEIRKSCLQFE